MRSARTSASRRRSPRPGSYQRETRLASCGRFCQEPVKAALETGQLLEQVRLERLDGQQRDQADQRADLEAHHPAVRELQNVVEEAVLLIPEGDPLAADVVHRAGDVEEVLEVLGGDILVDAVGSRQLQRDGHHVEAEHPHPGGAVGLLQIAARRQRLAAVEDADVVEAEESALEDVAPGVVLAVDPPGEVHDQLVEDALQELAVAARRVTRRRSGRRARRPRR